MSLRLQEKDFDFPFEVTPVKENLITEIAEAMHDAYEGTIDYEGENLSHAQAQPARNRLQTPVLAPPLARAMGTLVLRTAECQPH